MSQGIKSDMLESEPMETDVLWLGQRSRHQGIQIPTLDREQLVPALFIKSLSDPRCRSFIRGSGHKYSHDVLPSSLRLGN